MEPRAEGRRRLTSVLRPQLLRPQYLPLIGAVALYVAAASVVAWRQTAVDYPVYLMAARGFLDGADVYRWGQEDFARVAAQLGISHFESSYIYPPLTALVAVPLLALPYAVGLFVWTLANGMAALATGLVLGGLAPDQSRRGVIEITSWLLVPVMTTLYAGQVNPIAVLLAACAVRVLAANMELTAGLLLAISLLLKPLAIGLLLYLAWRFRWRVVLAVFASTIAALAVCWATFGVHALAFAERVAVWTPRHYPPSQNLPGLVARWLIGPSGLSDHAVSSNLTLLVAVAAAGALVVVTIAFCWPPGRARRFSTAELACVLMAVLLAHARTWYHHFVIAALPIAFLVSAARRRTCLWWVVLGVAYGAIQVFGVGWHHFADDRLALDSATLGGLLLWIMALIDVRREGEASDLPFSKR